MTSYLRKLAEAGSSIAFSPTAKKSGSKSNANSG
jgi:hypothetical protein